MAALKRNPVPRTSKATDGDGTGTGTSDAHAHAHDYSHASSSSLARAMREFKDLVQSFEAGLRRSLEDSSLDCPVSSQHIRREACRLAIADFSSRYTRKDIRDSLDAAECEGKRLEEQLQQLSLTSGGPTSISDQEDEDEEDKDLDHDHDHNNLGGLHHGHFRLYSTELFELLGQPTDLRFGLLRFHKHPTDAIPLPGDSAGVTIELALNNSYFVADSEETLPYHTFRLPSGPSLQNRGILSRKPEDDGAFPAYDSWLLFTFLGNGCIKVEVPIEMCADVYGDRLRGREDEDVLFWGFFVDDDAE